MRLRDIRRKLVWSVLLGVAVIAGLALYGDVREVGAHLAGFAWRYAPLILGLTVINYGLRFLKWQFYLGVVKASLPWRRSLLIFVSAFPMVLTPGKVGELLKVYFVKRSNGTPMSVTAPIVFAERVTDGLAMFILATAGILTLGRSGPLFWGLAAVAAMMLAFVLLSRWRWLVEHCLTLWKRLPKVGRFEPLLRTAYESTFDIFALKRLVFAVGLGVISWGCECAALYLTLVALGVEGGVYTLMVAVFTMAVATLVGAVSFLPGGLGAADLSLTGLMQTLLSLPSGLTVAATLIIRFFTLWFGVTIGLVALAILLRQLDIDADLELELSDRPTSTVPEYA
jgi:uncharacterized protein (TIRG00374 family)